MGDHIYDWLNVALDWGITEQEFWNMTLAEATRAIESKKRTSTRQAQERASFDYILADLIGRSVARIYSSTNNLPPIAEAYPSLFVAEELEEKMQEKKDEASAIRFRQFAQSFNKKFMNDGGGKKE